MAVSDTDLKNFCDAVLEKRRAANVAHKFHPEAETVTSMRGPKFARIVLEGRSYRSVFCFVDLQNGNILKAAGWKAPAKHARGNIANGVSDVTECGAVYLN